jgi:hypothetical protein
LYPFSLEETLQSATGNALHEKRGIIDALQRSIEKH